MSDATSVDAASVLFGLEDEFGVLEVQRLDLSAVKVIIEQTARDGPCPACGVVWGAVKDRPVMPLNTPHSGHGPSRAACSMITITVVASTRRTSRTLNSCSDRTTLTSWLRCWTL
jgi:hypothetical protein